MEKLLYEGNKKHFDKKYVRQKLFREKNMLDRKFKIFLKNIRQETFRQKFLTINVRQKIFLKDVRNKLVDKKC